MTRIVVASAPARPAWPASDALPRRVIWIGGIISALVSAIIFLVCTRHGIGIRPDTLRYMGLGFDPNDAPLYGWLLAGVSALGVDRWLAAKVIGFALVCINSLLIWLILARATGRFSYTAVGTVLIILSPLYVYWHAVAMSEPLFLTAIFGTLLVFLKYLQSEMLIWLASTGVAIGLATLVRFPGIALGGATAGALLLDFRWPVSRRIINICIVAAVGGVVTAGWMFTSLALTGHAVGRNLLHFYGNPDAQRWRQGVETLSVLLLPQQVPGLIRYAILLCVVAGGTWFTVNHARDTIRVSSTGAKLDNEKIAIFLGLFSVFYVAFLILAVYIEWNLPLHPRYGLPLYVALAIALTAMAARPHPVGQSQKLQLRRWAIGALGVVGVLVLASNVARTVAAISEAYGDGIGFASVSWETSPIIQAVTKLPAGAVIYSNGPEAIIYDARREAHLTPRRVHQRTEVDMTAKPFVQQLQELRRELTIESTFVVFLDRVDWRSYLATEADLVRTLELRLVDSERDGRIYARHDTD